MKNVIYIMHPGTANYPEIKAYREYFSDRYTVLDGTKEDYENSSVNGDCILWCIMGFYPRQYKARFIIHDYRSLSIGRFCAIKDTLKKLGNTTPDARIFQNETMEAVMGFRDGVKSLILPMGVPSSIVDVNKHSNPKFIQEFCYIGEMSYERKFDKLLDTFVRNYPESNMVLVGNAESEIFEKYSNHKNLIFTGKLPQLEALSIVKTCNHAICYFPYHRPHKFQAPTKLLEYMMLHSSIVCNDSPSNVRTLEEFKYPGLVTDKYIFTDKNIISKLKALEGIERPKIKIVWSDVIYSSGVERLL